MSDATDAVRHNLSKAPYEAVISLESSPIPPMGYSVYSVRRKSTISGR